MVGVEGFIGIGGLVVVRLFRCERYQAKILWPNFWGEELAPATAIRGEDMNVRAAVCMLVVVVAVVVFSVGCGFEGAGISGWFRRFGFSFEWMGRFFYCFVG